MLTPVPYTFVNGILHIADDLAYIVEGDLIERARQADLAEGDELFVKLTGKSYIWKSSGPVQKSLSETTADFNNLTQKAANFEAIQDDLDELQAYSKRLRVTIESIENFLSFYKQRLRRLSAEVKCVDARIDKKQLELQKIARIRIINSRRMAAKQPTKEMVINLLTALTDEQRNTLREQLMQATRK